ncbi:MAG: MoaD/ThiS family protein [Prolixibacteraceae bacterium]|jgi:molybdopterin converting factor small subunit|nr:MoaD/ThiS family protein [Prolixibacteraceae bacterium]
MEKYIRIKLFGIAVEKIGKRELNFPLVPDTEKLNTSLIEKFPILKEIKFSIAVNRRLVNENSPLTEDSEVALLPPFSGG